MEKSLKSQKRKKVWENIKRNKMVYVFLLPAVLLVFLFNYVPLPGLIIAFLDYDPFLGFKSDWVGFANIKELFQIPEFTKSIGNTVWLSTLGLLIQFPLPIIFALMLNELKNGPFKKFTQTVSYLPHFLSAIAVVGIVITLASNYGIINDIYVKMGGERTLWLTKQELFVPIVITLGVWQGLGWSSIIYLASIAGIDSSLYEAAIIDGAGKLRQCIYITIPGIATTAIMLFILSIGSLFQSNFDLIYGLQNAFIDFEVISTTIYKKGITQGNYSMSTALGFVQGFISLILVLITNKVSKKVNDVSIL